MRPAEVFLSHASADRAFASELAEALRSHGVPVWYSRTDIRGTQQWHDEIGAALGRCDWFLVVLTPAAVESMWVKRELLYALRDRRYEKRIGSVLLDDCEHDDLSWVLAQDQFLDFRTDRAAGYRELFKAWGIGYRPSAAEDRSPE